MTRLLDHLLDAIVSVLVRVDDALADLSDTETDA